MDIFTVIMVILITCFLIVSFMSLIQIEKIHTESIRHNKAMEKNVANLRLTKMN